MKLFAVTLLSLFSFLADAQTFSIGIERRAEIIPSWPDVARDVQLASRGDDFAAVWRTATDRVVATMIGADGKPGTTVTPLSQRGANPRIVSAGHGYLTAWETNSGHQISTAHIYEDGSKGLEFVPVTDFDLDASSMRLAGGGYRSLLVWIRRIGENATLFAVVLDAYGQRASRTITISEDATVSHPSAARAGANFVVAFRTVRGIEAALIDARDGSVDTRLVSSESAEAMTVVSGPAAPVVFYTPAQTNATYGIALTATDETPHLVAEGRLLTAVATDGRPVVALSMPDGRVALYQARPFREARELTVPGARIETADSIAWNGTNLLVASGRTSTDVVLAGLDGRTARAAMLGFRFTNRHLVDVATAGGVDLLVWFDSIEEETRTDYAFGRFHDLAALDGGGVRTIWSPVAASDGVSTFLVAGVHRSSSTAAVAQIVPVDGERSPLIDLGEGRVLDAIWDGTDFIVFLQSSTRRLMPEICAYFDAAVHAVRIRRDGTILSPAGGDLLLTGENISWLQAVPTRAGFTLAYNRDTRSGTATCSGPSRTRIVAYSNALTTLRAIDPLVVQADADHSTVSIAGNGTDRVVVAIESKQPGSGVLWRRTLMLNERGEQQWSADGGAPAAVRLDDGFVFFFPPAGFQGTIDAVHWRDGDRPRDLSAGENRTRFDILSAPAVLAATSPQRTIVAYARLAILPTGDIVRRLIRRTITALPKAQ